MSYRVKTEAFDGPFDLLLYLVSRQRVDIEDISIAEITDQYLAEISRMQRLDLDVASDFLVVASTLLEVKAESLVPRERDEVEEEIAEIPAGVARDMLIARLVEYKQYKNAAGMLSNRFEAASRQHARPFGPDPEFLRVMPDFLTGVDLDSLALKAAGAFARRERFLLSASHIEEKYIPVDVQVRSIHEKLQRSKRVSFSDLADARAPIPVKVVTFLAVLELVKRGMARAVQGDTFSEIEIQYIEGSGELVIDDDHAITSVKGAVE